MYLVGVSIHTQRDVCGSMTVNERNTVILEPRLTRVTPQVSGPAIDVFQSHIVDLLFDSLYGRTEQFLFQTYLPTSFRA